MFKKVLGWFKRHWITIICTILAGVLGAFNFYNLWSIGWYHRPVLRLFWDGCLLGLPLAALTIGAVLSGARAGAIVGGVGYLLFYYLYSILSFRGIITFDTAVHVISFALFGGIIGKLSSRFNKNLIVVTGIIVSGVFLLVFPIVSYELIEYVAKMKSFGIPFCLGVFLGGVISSLLIINLFQKLSQKTE